MEDRVGTQREEVRRLVFKYRKDIVHLEEKEEDLVRRIQILENLIPTVLVWYMWKVDQTKRDVQFSQWTKEESMNKLHHLETVLKELQTADEAMKREETVLRKRIEELEESLDGDPFANICVKPSSPLVSLTHDQVKSDIALLNRKIKKMNEKRVQFVDFLEDSDRDWQKTCEELVNEVNNLRDILDQSNVRLKESTMHMEKIGSSLRKDDAIKRKIDYLEDQTKSLQKEVVDQEKTNIAREESQEEKLFSMVQDAMDEVDSLKQVLKDSKKSIRAGDRAHRDVGFKTPIIHTISEQEEDEKEEAETDLGEANSPVVYPVSAENKPSPSAMDFQDKYTSEARSPKQETTAPLTSSDMPKGSLNKGPTALSIKSIDRPGSVEVDTTTNIQLPPSTQVDQLQVGILSLDNLSLESTRSAKRASDSSEVNVSPDAEKLQSENLLLRKTSQIVGEKYTNPSKLHSVSGEDLPTSAFIESFEEIPRSSVPIGAANPETTPHSRTDLHETVVTQSPLSTSTPEPKHPPTETFSKSSLSEAVSPKTATAVSKEPPDQTNGSETVGLQSHSQRATSETADPLTSPTKAEFPETTSLPINTNGATYLVTEKSDSKAHPNQTNVVETINNQPYSSDKAFKAASPPTLPTPTTTLPTPTTAAYYEPEFPSKPHEQSSKSVDDGLGMIPVKAAKSKEFPTSVKLNLDKAEADTITPEPYEVPNTDGDLPTSSGLMLKQQGQDNVRSHPNKDNLANNDLQSKCRVKDHLIKSLADGLREQAHGNISPRNKLLTAVSEDPVKTYDFDRHTLAKYLKGEGPRDIDATLRSDPVYSNTNQLNVEVLRKLDQSSLIIRWGPPPPQEVAGFQIFIDGEFVYWVHSATRKMALLQPLDLSKKLEIAVSPVNSKGNIISRSSVMYIPAT